MLGMAEKSIHLIKLMQCRLLSNIAYNVLNNHEKERSIRKAAGRS